MISETPLMTDTFEGISVILQCPKTKCSVRVYVTYRRPPSPLSRAFMDYLSLTLNAAARHPNEAIICGDCSVHYGNPRSVGAMTGATHVSGNMLDLVITPCSPILIATVTPTTLATYHRAVECDFLVVKPARPKCRVRYRKYASIEKRAFANDICDALSVSSGSTVELTDTYVSAIANIVDKHAPIITRVFTFHQKTPWHTEKLANAIAR